MKKEMKLSVVALSLICLLLIVSPACTAGLGSLSLKKKTMQTQTPETMQSQYWAVLCAVGVYLNAPEKNRESMQPACENLTEVLLASSSYWQASNIHVLKGREGILQNLIKELLWLRKNSKSEDYVLVYITTHGGQLKKNGLPWDIPPKDEADGTDEFLVMYNGFDKWYGIIWDDLLNFFLSIIKCKGMCLIIDSCYSGGFNDNPIGRLGQHIEAESIAYGFAQELAAPGRVVLMSCMENEASYGSDFTNLITAGLDGWADTSLLGASGNGDGIVSAQEAFRLADFWLELLSYQSPTISDTLGQEFPLTYT
jgi:hypothetical protein